MTFSEDQIKGISYNTKPLSTSNIINVFFRFIIEGVCSQCYIISIIDYRKNKTVCQLDAMLFFVITIIGWL